MIVAHRSFWSLALLLVVVAFSAGCESNGLDSLETTTPTNLINTNNPTTTINTNLVTIVPTITVNRTVLTSQRAALTTDGIRLTLLLNDGQEVGMIIASMTASTIAFEPPAPVEVSKLNSNAVGSTSWVLSVRANINGVNLPLSLTVSRAIRGATVTATSANVNIAVTLSSYLGATSYRYTVTAIPLDGNAAVTGTAQEGGTAGVLPDLYVSRVTAFIDGHEATLGQYVTEGVPFANPTFTIYFNDAIMAVPSSFTLITRSLSDNHTITFNGLAGIATTSLDSTGRQLSVTLTPGATDPRLKPWHIYEVTVTGAHVVAATGTGTATLATGTSWRFRTRKAGLSQWVARSTDGTMVGLWQYGQVSTSTVRTSASRLELTFDYPTAKPAMASATFRVGSSVTHNYDQVFAPPQWAIDGLSCTIDFLPGQNLSASRTYVINYVGGTMADQNGMPLATAQVGFVTLP